MIAMLEKAIGWKLHEKEARPLMTEEEMDAQGVSIRSCRGARGGSRGGQATVASHGPQVANGGMAGSKDGTKTRSEINRIAATCAAARQAARVGPGSRPNGAAQGVASSDAHRLTLPGNTTETIAASNKAKGRASKGGRLTFDQRLKLLALGLNPNEYTFVSAKDKLAERK